MMDQGSEFSFPWGPHLKINIRIDICLSIRPTTTRLSNQVHLDELNQMKLIKQVQMTSSHEDHLKN